MIGSLILNHDPSLNLEAATRQYVDSLLAGKVNRSGDTMTYTLKITNPNQTPTTDTTEAAAELILDKPGNTFAFSNNIWGFTQGVPRWCMMLGNDMSEGTGWPNAGSQFELKRYTDAGLYIDSPLQIAREFYQTSVQIIDGLSITNYNGQYASGFKDVVLSLNKAGGSYTDGTGGYARIQGNHGSPRWMIDLGDGTPEGPDGSNKGSNFVLSRWPDSSLTGIPLDYPIIIYRDTGDIIINHDPVQPLGVATKQYVDNFIGSGGTGDYLPLTGGTLGWPLIISEIGPTSDLILNSQSGQGTSNNIFGKTLGINR
jgi:hypothetical protein